MVDGDARRLVEVQRGGHIEDGYRIDEKSMTQVFRQLQDTANDMSLDDVPQALTLLGFRDVNEEWVRQLAIKKELGEFVRLQGFMYLVTHYRERCSSVFVQEFKSADSTGSGKLDLNRIMGALQKANALVPYNVLKELIDEVRGTSGTDEARTLIVSEYVKLREIIEYRGGFTSTEAQEIRALYRRYDKDANGTMSRTELGSAISWLGLSLRNAEGFVMPNETHGPSTEELLAATGLPSGCDLSVHDFMQVIRRLREFEIESLRHTCRSRFGESWFSHILDADSVVSIFKELGYSASTRVAVRECAIFSGVWQEAEAGFPAHDLFLVLRTFREREGLEESIVQECMEAFQDHATQGTADRRSAGVIEFGGALRWMGIPIMPEYQQELFDAVDVDCSGEIDYDEFLKVVRMYKEAETAKLEKAFTKEAAKKSTGTITVNQLRTILLLLGYYIPLKGMDKLLQQECEGRQLDFQACSEVVSVFKSKARELFRQCCGFDNAAIGELKEQFKKYDPEDSGSIANSHLRRLLEDIFPQAHTLEGHRVVASVLAAADENGDGRLDYPEFLQLMRSAKDYQHYQRTLKENRIARRLGMQEEEAREYRQIFRMCKSHCPREIKLNDMLAFCKQIREISPTVEKVIRDVLTQADRNKNEMLDFPEFLEAVAECTKRGLLTHG